MVGLLPLGFSRMDPPVDAVNTTSDASGEDDGLGNGVVEARADPSDLAVLFKLSERWRPSELLPN